MSNDAVSVVTLSAHDEAALLKAQESVAAELNSSRDVVILCECELLLREERLRLARPAMTNQQGRIAIVSHILTTEQDLLPSDIRNRVQFFRSMDTAMRWLRPQAMLAARTFRYVSLR